MICLNSVREFGFINLLHFDACENRDRSRSPSQSRIPSGTSTTAAMSTGINGPGISVRVFATHPKLSNLSKRSQNAGPSKRANKCGHNRPDHWDEQRRPHLIRSSERE